MSFEESEGGVVNVWCRFVRLSESGKGMLIVADIDGKEYWLPTSQVEPPEAGHADKSLCLPVPKWLARSKGLA